MNKRILIVEDEKNIVDILSFNLSKEGYETLEAYDGEAGLQLALEQNPDLILLDLMLPKMNGFDVCRSLRRENRSTPVIMLTAREEETDKVLGLELGADDYITKPFSLMVLRARIRALLRRSAGGSKQEYVKEPFRFCFETMEFYKDHIPVELSRTEQRILYLLVTNAGRILTRERLMEWVWPEGTEYVEDNALSVGIRRLRDKLEDSPSKPEYIRTVYGKGYIWQESQEL